MLEGCDELRGWLWWRETGNMQQKLHTAASKCCWQRVTAYVVMLVDYQQ
jgi:hypothetical protein